MSDILSLIGQIVFIACLQIVFEMFIDQSQKPYLSKLLSVACYAGALLLIMQFIFSSLMPEIQSMFNMAF